MASMKRRPDGRWRARYRDAAGKEHAKHFTRKVDAQRWLDEVTASIVTGLYVDPKSGRITVAAYAAGWEASQVGREGTARILDNALRLHILPRLGTRPMHSVRRSDIQSLVKALETYAAGTVRNVYDAAARLFAAAVDDRVIAVTPCQRIVLPRGDKGEIVPPTVEDVAALSAAIHPRYRAGVVLLAGSGLRIGEALGLKVADVDFLRRTVRVERQRLQSGDIAPPKTAKSTRTVPLGKVVVDELAAHLAAHPSEEWLFTRADGGPLAYRTWKSAWRAANTKAELKLVTHDMRHFTASALIAAGINVKQISVVLGHANAAITLRVYSHLWPGGDDHTRSAMDATLGVLRTGCGPIALPSGSAAGQEG